MNRASQILASTIKAQQDSIPRPMQLLAEGSRYTLPDGSSWVIQSNLYEKLTWVATAIDFVAEAAAITKFSVKKRQGEETVDIPNHPFEIALQRPNPMQSTFEFWRDYFSWRKLTGNAYIYLNRDNENDEPAEYWIIPSNMIEPVPDGASYIKGYKLDTGSGTVMLEPWQVSHNKSFNPRSLFVGLSAVQSLAVVGWGDMAQQNYATKVYDKDNAKIPGALAFGDYVQDPQWMALQNEAKEKWGGTKQSGPMWLRGVGAGGVQWVQMAISPKDMQALDSRQFTKTEIWSKLAPGLASILDPNATEANALAGKAIMDEKAIYPLLVQTAQKATSDILPAYGPNLVGEFDDPRKSDRLMDLQEQEKYMAVHTVNEVRQEYYGDDPIEGGDVPVDAWVSASKPAPVVQPPANQNGQPDTSNNAEAQNANAEAQVNAEMKAWQAFELKRLGKARGREFDARSIPLFQVTAIRSALKSAATPEQVRDVFAGGWVDSGESELKRSNDLLERALEKL
jgi:HK97 family phage portal protein